MIQAPLWTRDFILISLVNFLLVLVFYLLVVVIGLYAIEELNASVSQSGLVVGMFVIGVLAGRLLIGQFIDRFGRKRSILAGLLLAFITCLLYYLETGIGFLIFNRFIHGVAVGIAATAIATGVALLIPASRRGEGVGYYGMSSSLATAIGPFIGIFMMHAAEFSLILAFCSLLSLICFFVALLLHVPEVSADTLAKAAEKKSSALSLDKWLEPKVVPICFIVFLGSLSYSSVLSFLNAYAAELNLSEAASFFFMVYAVTLLISRPLCGRLMDVKGANIIMYPGFVVFGLGLVLLGVADSGLKLLSAACLIGLGFGNMQSCGQAIAIKLADPARLGLATSTYFIFVDSGLGFGPYLLGLSIAYSGYSNLYLILGLITFCSMGLYYFLHGRHAAASKSSVEA